jgi:hypothetical protein
MPGRLIERNGEGAGTAHPLRVGVTTIGRSDDNDIVVTGGHVSRHHAEVRWDGARYVLNDLQSKNGVLLNGRRVTVPEPLQHDDVITLPGQPGLLLAVDLADETHTLRWEDPGDATAQPAGGGEPAPAEAAAGAIRVDIETAELWVRGRRVHITRKEYLALVLLADACGRLVTKDALAAHVWPEYHGDVGDASIERLISRLRRKLEADPAQPRHLLTVRGLGYRLVEG